MRERLMIEAPAATPIAERRMELVERKGIGHPDTICDALVEVISHALSGMYLVVVKKEDGYAMAVLPASCLIDISRLRGLIGRGEIESASVEEIRRIAPACEPGGLPPFGELFGMPTRASPCATTSRRRPGTSTPRSGYAPANT